MKRRKIDLTKGDTYKADAQLTEMQLIHKIEGHEEMKRLNDQGHYGDRPDLNEICDQQIMRYKNELKKRKTNDDKTWKN